MRRTLSSVTVLVFWTLCPLILGWPTPLLSLWSDGIKSAFNRIISSNNSIQAESSRVLNFFPVPVSLECGADDGRRRGLCLNTYDCRIQHGTSYGKCAYGFGVCCVWHMTCGQESANNITYFTNPGFPSATSDVGECAIRVKKIAPEISQLRLDFLHFTLITQIEFNQRAPAGCTQYFTEPSGIIQTWNFAINGRHLSNQDYVICMRQNEEMCSIAYEPCDENSFKIGPPGNMMILGDDAAGSGDGPVVQLDDTRECSDRIMMPCDFEEFLTDRK
ncbi:hypothetical protein WDU94_004641 [Cyamophila willieti]